MTAGTSAEKLAVRPPLDSLPTRRHRQVAGSKPLPRDGQLVHKSLRQVQQWREVKPISSFGHGFYPGLCLRTQASYAEVRCLAHNNRRNIMTIASEPHQPGFLKRQMLVGAPGP